MSDAPERILELIASGVYAPAIDAGVRTMCDAMLRGTTASLALSSVAVNVSASLDLPSEEVASDLDLLFLESMGLTPQDYAKACAKERDPVLADFALAEARKGGPRPPKTRSTGSVNWMLQDPGPDGGYDPVYVRDIAEINPGWVVTSAERDEYRYRSGRYSRVEDKSFNDLHDELQAVYAEHYVDRGDVGFEDMVRMFADDDFYHCHYVARSYLGKIASGDVPSVDRHFL